MDDEKYEDGEVNLPDEDDFDDSDNIARRDATRAKPIEDEDFENEISESESDAESVDMDSDDNSDIDEDVEEEEDENGIDNPRTESALGREPGAFLEIEDDEDDDEDDGDDNYLQKFDESIQQHIIEDFHPELKMHNHDEIEILSRIVRDQHGNIIDPLHKTLPFLTRYEKARILGERAKQLNAGAKSTIELESNIIDGYLIAMKEFDAKKIPFVIKRPLPNGGCEYWRFSDLEVLS